ncbi:MAG: prepilin-type N-terminal cleavage/methylation domain-containing protein [Candidatus Gastranaerophilales bacterium]|nr:prepilin-type N-terminal cleavage/methylation domain-containing protein [Candidatus Gastranaerophilales bacterium]
MKIPPPVADLRTNAVNSQLNILVTRKSAFTLAEVLVTLVIIGIIAGITIPVIVNNYMEQATVLIAKKNYSTLANAIKLAITKNGPVSRWNLEPSSGEFNSKSAEKFANYIKPFLNVMNDCGTDKANDCMGSDYYTLLNGNDQVTYGSSSNYYKMILNDGSLIWFRTCNSAEKKSGYYAKFWIDINGYDKKPNQIGKDTFHLFVKKYELIGSTSDDCYIGGTGWGCINHILLYSDMKYPEKKS